MRRISGLSRSIDHIRLQPFSKSPYAFTCIACRQRATFTTSLLRAEEKPVRLVERLTSTVKNKIWKAETPEEEESSLPANERAEKKRQKRIEEWAKEEGISTEGLEPEPVREEQPEEYEEPIPPYKPAQSSEDLEWVGGAPEERKDFSYQGFMPVARPMNNEQITAALHRAVVEVYTLRQAGRDLAIPSHQLNESELEDDITTEVQFVEIEKENGIVAQLKFPQTQTMEKILESLAPKVETEAELVEEMDETIEESYEVAEMTAESEAVEEPEGVEASEKVEESHGVVETTESPDKVGTLQPEAEVQQEGITEARRKEFKKKVPESRGEGITEARRMELRQKAILDAQRKEIKRRLEQRQKEISEARHKEFKKKVPESHGVVKTIESPDKVGTLQPEAEARQKGITEARRKGLRQKSNSEARRKALPKKASKTLSPEKAQSGQQHLEHRMSDSVARQEPVWLQVSLIQPDVKFAVIKRTLQLTGIRVPDNEVESITDVKSLLGRLLTPPKPKTVSEAVVQTGELDVLTNVSYSKRRITKVDDQKAVGRWKVIKKELKERNLWDWKGEN